MGRGREEKGHQKITLREGVAMMKRGEKARGHERRYRRKKKDEGRRGWS